MTASTHKNIFTALCAAQINMGPAIKDSANPAFKSRYADLASVFNAVLPALNAEGITLMHIQRDMLMDTVLVHGQTDTSVTCTVPLIVSKNDMQGMKSATTYAKRIGTESICGIAPEDDDGNAAAKAPPVIHGATTPRALRINASQFEQLRSLAVNLGVDLDKMCEHYKVDLLDELDTSQYAEAMRLLEKRHYERQMNNATHEGEQQ